jgi:hypothetical protein
MLTKFWGGNSNNRAFALAVNDKLWRLGNWPLFWYTFQDAGTSTSTSENFFGLLNYDGSTKWSYQTLQWAIAAGL